MYKQFIVLSLVCLNDLRVVRRAGFKPVADESRSGSIPPLRRKDVLYIQEILRT